MIAAVLKELPASALEVTELALPEPGPGEVLVQVSACGICGTDLHVMAGESYRPALPFVLGHELVGLVTAAGSPMESGWVGHAIVPTLFTGCGSCAPCQSGEERLCQYGPRIVGVLGSAGGFAGHVVLRASQLVKLPSNVPPVVAATLVDAGATARNAAHMATASSGFGPRSHLVLGGGPVGLLVAQLLASAQEEVIVVEGNPLRRAVLHERGLSAVGALPSLESPFTSVVDCAGSAALVAPALALLQPHGTYIAAGYAKVPELDLALVARRELSVRGVRSGRRSDLEDVLALVSKGELLPPPIKTWPLAQVNKAISALRKGEVAGKAVITVDAAEGADQSSQLERCRQWTTSS